MFTEFEFNGATDFQLGGTNGVKLTPVLLESNQQYLDLLKSLKKRTAYIVLVQICGEDSEDKNLQAALQYMRLLQKKSVRKWLGTIRWDNRAVEYIFEADVRFFKYLKTFSSFFFNRKTAEGWDDVEETDFGQDDIAFLDSQKQVLFYTTTHEGDAYILPSLCS